MESLEGTDWDVVICGTGLPQSLLALSLSRSELKVLHVDPNGYYGGREAALSISEAEAWAEKHGGETTAAFSHAKVTKIDPGETGDNKLLSSRAYSIALAPHLIYSRSSLIDALVSSRTHNQLEFQAVGSWFILNTSTADSSSKEQLTRVPGGREAIFQDTTLDLKEKRALMKFIRFVSKYEEEPEVWQNCDSTTFPAFLQERFNLPPSAQAPLLALSMATTSPADTKIEAALSGIARHLKSIGYFGAGFGAVLPKWGGLAEVGQVACRSCAVGGGVYVLGHGISQVDSSDKDMQRLTLSNGENVKTKWLCGSAEDLPVSKSSTTEGIPVSKCICTVSSPLASLFPQTSEGGVTPAGAVVYIAAEEEHQPPVHILIHSSESGECPSNQSILYTSVAQSHADGFPRLKDAIQRLLQSVGESPVPQILWSMNYQHRSILQGAAENVSRTFNDRIVVLPLLSAGIVLEDEVLEAVKAAWLPITNADPNTFMRFEVRDGALDDDDDET